MIYIIIALVLLLLAVMLFSKITFSFEYKKHPGEKLYKSIHLSVGIIKLDRFLKKSGEPLSLLSARVLSSSNVSRAFQNAYLIREPVCRSYNPQHRLRVIRCKN